MRKTIPAAMALLSLSATLPAQEKASARDMYFGGFDAAPAPRKPAPAAAAVVRKVSAPVAKKPAATPPTTLTPSTHRNALPAATPSGVPVIHAANERTALGLRYALLKMNGLDAVEVPASTRFRSGDRIQLKIQTNNDGYLYLVTQGTSGAWQVLFPAKSKNQGSNRVKANDEHTSMFRLEGKPGVEKLFVVFSRAPEKDLDSVIYSLKSGQPVDAPKAEPMMLASNLTVSDPLVERLRTSYTRDLVLEEVAAPESAERAVYVVSKNDKADARVVADIKLIHE